MSLNYRASQHWDKHDQVYGFERVSQTTGFIGSFNPDTDISCDTLGTTFMAWSYKVRKHWQKEVVNPWNEFFHGKKHDFRIDWDVESGASGMSNDPLTSYSNLSNLTVMPRDEFCSRSGSPYVHGLLEDNSFIDGESIREVKPELLGVDAPLEGELSSGELEPYGHKEGYFLLERDSIDGELGTSDWDD
jgi:hypothetical protein